MNEKDMDELQCKSDTTYELKPRSVARCEILSSDSNVPVLAITNPDDILLLNFYYVSTRDRLETYSAYMSIMRKIAHWWMESSVEEKEHWRLMMNLAGDEWRN